MGLVGSYARAIIIGWELAPPGSESVEMLSLPGMIDSRDGVAPGSSQMRLQIICPSHLMIQAEIGRCHLTRLIPAKFMSESRPAHLIQLYAYENYGLVYLINSFQFKTVILWGWLWFAIKVYSSCLVTRSPNIYIIFSVFLNNIYCFL